MTGAPLTRRVVVRGRVQGVGFRWWMVEEAQALGLDGWVRNRRDGTVEAVLRGPADAVAEMLRRCEIGPPAARVRAVEAAEEPGPVAPGFRQLPTA
jgi:acylphosphatase